MATLGSELHEQLQTLSMEITHHHHHHHQRSLPQHLIFEHILPRLPVKPLTRFKTISKIWYSIISSSQFANSHLNFSSLRPQFVVHTTDYNLGPKLFLLPCDYNDDAVDLGLDRNCVITSLKIVGSCNGLLCLLLQVSMAYEYFCVWNPVTNQFREIKNPVGVAMGYDYAFGYVSSTDDYKIAAVFCPNLRETGNLHVFSSRKGRLYVFSLRDGEWRMVDGVDESGKYNAWSYCMTLVCRDTWTSECESMDVWQKVNQPVWIDFVDDKFKQIPWIDCFNEYKRGKFFEMRGVCMSFYCEGDQGCCSDVWVLNQFGDENSWEKRFSFDLEGMCFRSFTHTGLCLAVTSSGQLKVVNVTSTSNEGTRVVSARFPGKLDETAVYVESLVSPFMNYS